LQISDYDACSLDIPAASPNFGVARVLIIEQKTIRKVGIELQLPEPLIGGAAVRSNRDLDLVVITSGKSGYSGKVLARFNSLP
jgi:hypothetical protein